jgi:folate-dependent phosphoribosylglycinamide formyltransferase PurN
MLLDNKRWVAFFSHTGSEIYKLSKKIGRFPDRVITNNPPDANINKQLKNRVDIVYVRDKPDDADYERVIKDEDSVVTLHGWMRIVPKKICKHYEIYNLHPGLITKYPELKGADPQKRVAEEPDESKYKKVGCVIHRVIHKVDEGKVLASCSTSNHFPGEATLTTHLHEMATQLWVDFLTHETDQPIP